MYRVHHTNNNTEEGTLLYFAVVFIKVQMKQKSKYYWQITQCIFTVPVLELRWLVTSLFWSSILANTGGKAHKHTQRHYNRKNKTKTTGHCNRSIIY